MTARSIALALVLPAALLVPIAALGDPEAAPKKKVLPAATDVKNDPENIVAISEFMETVYKGNTAFMAKDYTTATDSYRKAEQLAPTNALGPYLLAEAYLGTGNLNEADAAITHAVEIAPGAPKEAATKARILFLRADIYERQKKWAEAKTAWQVYLDAAAKVSGDGGAFPATGQERIKALQKVIDQDQKYVAVRERIAADKADAGAKGAPKKK
jgi:Flp pilus assembly protein TadD